MAYGSEGEPPSWSELADALYLAAVQDAAVPPRDPPRRSPVQRRAAVGTGTTTGTGNTATSDTATNTGTGTGTGAGTDRAPSTGPRSDTAAAQDRSATDTDSTDTDSTDAADDTADDVWERETGPRPPRHSALGLVPLGASASGRARPSDSLAIGRALRPLRLSRPSPYEVELDEEATAEQAAVDGLWTPVCRSTRERLLDLLLLVDAGPPMALWRRSAHRVRALMEQTAAFRTVRLVPWHPDGAPGAGPAATAQAGERQLLLVLTDGADAAWRDGRAATRLHALAASSPTAVLSLLPQQLWDLTLPTVARTRLRSATPGAANRSYDARWTDPGADALGPRPASVAPPAQGRDRAIAVPVVELRAESLGRWARLVAGGERSEWHSLAALLTGPDRDLRADLVDPEAEDLTDAAAATASLDAEVPRPTASARAARAADAVRRFRSTASPTAYVLARRLAAVPLNLPVMRVLQQALPGAEFWNLAEIVLRGLVRRTDASADVEDAARVSFDFAGGVREELLALGSRAETVGALRQVQQHLGPRLEALWHGGASLVDPDGAPRDLPLTEQTRPFVAHLYTALCALSGPYLARANHLGRLLQHDTPQLIAAAPREQRRPLSVAGARPTTPSISTRKRPERYIFSDSVSHFTSGTKGAVPYGPQKPPSAANTPSRAGSSKPPRSQAPPDSPSPSLPPARLHEGGTAVSAGLPVAPAPRGPHEPPRIWGNVPQRNRNFTGREALLEQLQSRLTSGVTAVLPEALHGMGGVGKSQIAIEYVYRHSRDYQLIWWIPAEQENQIVQSLIELGEQMGLQAGAEISAVPAVLNALRVGEPYSDWLLVFDNAEDPKEVRKYFPSDGPGRILVTSRNSQWSSTASSLEVNVFAREESIALLRRRSPQLPDEAVDHLASALGDLPLAVEQAAVWLAETGMPVQQYLELFERKWAELLQSDPPADYEMPVAAAWNVSLERLRDDSPDALQLLQVAAFFAPEPISWDLFSAVRGVSVPQALQATLDDPVKLGRAVREIGRYALARIDHRASTIQLHRLVQRVLVEQMNPQEQAQMRHAAHQLLSNADPRSPQRAAHWTGYSALLPHLVASNAVECEEGWTRRLVLNEVWFLRLRGDISAALSLGERASAIWREKLGEDHEEVLAIDQQLAQALREQGVELERAHALQADLVNRFGRVLGEEHEDTLQAQSYLAIHHRNRGDFYQARELDQRVYENTIREFGPDDPATLLAAHNLAVSLRLAGDPEAARALDQDTWQRRVEVLGSDHLYTLTTFNAYLLDLQEIGRYEESAEGYEQLSATLRDQFGEDHWFTMQVTRNLCVTRRKKGDHEGAYELSTHGLTLVRKRYGETGRYFLQMALSHAVDLRQIGKLQESRALNAQVLEQHIEQYGHEHPHTYAVALNLAVVLRLLGEHEPALELDQNTVDGLTRVLGPEHPRTLLARMNLASDHFALGHPEEAHTIDKKVAEETERLRLNHPANLAVQLNLSHDLKALGRHEESRLLYERALSTYREILGPSHPATRDAERGLRANADVDLISL
ncbi:FxSxx-COOH system tetratricopeptide repeat protein [Streptomyces sp. NPDC020965]|uniref:FxSxx-COOH system tetratricopeptide repeat protein n=1 Tax=Streptomyces sp. NPDC020965 TaxID=3365105 RepID=UPI0037B09E6B